MGVLEFTTQWCFEFWTRRWLPTAQMPLKELESANLERVKIENDQEIITNIALPESHSTNIWWYFVCLRSVDPVRRPGFFNANDIDCKNSGVLSVWLPS